MSGDTVTASIAAAALLCLLALLFVQHKPCYVSEQTIGSMKIAEFCGTMQERTAVNDE